MIVSLRGSLVDVQAKSVVIDVGGIGYEVMVTAAVLRLLPPLMEELFIHTYLHVQDDAMVLYGFSSLEERSLFREIISISGIGPKKAIGMLSSIGPSEFIRAVQERQLSVLTSLPGIGKKTAERILLELKDKFKDPVWDQAEHEPAATRIDIVDDAVDALIALGYSQAEALHMVKSAKDKLTDNNDLQELLKLALASNSR